MSNQPNNIDFLYCNYHNPKHSEKLVELMNYYIADPMGGGQILDLKKGQMLITGLSAHPASFVLFISYNSEIVGLATCFVNFSTFKVKPYLNLHDIIIKNDFRGKGLGKALLEKIVCIASERGYCKITLEVREDNTNAKTLYNSLGFRDTEPLMHFWTKTI